MRRRLAPKRIVKAALVRYRRHSDSCGFWCTWCKSGIFRSPGVVAIPDLLRQWLAEIFDTAVWLSHRASSFNNFSSNIYIYIYITICVYMYTHTNKHSPENFNIANVEFHVTHVAM